jgi:sterol desaturase/sphingolipid hydroxylase (fatty acid hydroxylase superfamily)
MLDAIAAASRIPPMGIAGTIVAVAVATALLLAAERSVPLRVQRCPWLRELAINIAFSAMAFGVSAAVVRPAIVSAIGWSERRDLGLVHLLALPPLARGVVVFLWLDLTFYYWHRLNHQWPLLWRFHNVHHCDPDLGVSTSFRFHFGEVVLSTVFRVLQITAVGASLPAYAVYETAFQLNTLFHHSNVRLPIRLERRLNRLLVTPRMHGIHHSQVREETNSNYSVVLPWWDRLHRTLRLNVPQSRIVIGVPGYAEPGDNQFWPLLAMPFRGQRPYWVGPGGEGQERQPGTLGPDLHRLEE